MQSLPKIDTADRLHEYDVLIRDGRQLIVASVSPAPTTTRPARLAVEVQDTRGPLTDTTETTYLDAGETVRFRTSRPNCGSQR
jgi:hypothetical protein